MRNTRQQAGDITRWHGTPGWNQHLVAVRWYHQVPWNTWWEWTPGSRRACRRHSRPRCLWEVSSPPWHVPAKTRYIDTIRTVRRALVSWRKASSVSGCKQLACSRHTAAEIELTTSWSQVRRPAIAPQRHPHLGSGQAWNWVTFCDPAT